MHNKKIKAPNLYLDERQYKFNGSDFGMVSLKEESFKSNFTDDIALKNVRVYEKCGEIYIENVKPFCSCNNSKKNISKGFVKRKIIFLNIGEITVNIKRYQCVKCGKYFRTDLTGLVENNSNISIRLKNKIVELYSIFKGSLHSICEFLKKDHNVDISYQTVENIILSNELDKKDQYASESGYYLFDVQYIKISGEWMYRYALFDSKLNIPVVEELMDNQRFKTTEEFLEENLKFRYVKCITTDGHPHYKRILSKLLYKHQTCTFHTKQEINHKIKRFIKQNKLSEEEKSKLMGEKELIFDIFNSESVEEARNKLNHIIDIKDKLSDFILKNVVVKLRDNFKNYVYFIENKNIECTSNKIENYFSKTMPKSIKKKFRSIQGVKSRIYLQSRRWENRNQKPL